MERRMLCVEGVGAQVGFNGFGTIIRNEAALTPCYSGKKAPERASSLVQVRAGLPQSVSLASQLLAGHGSAPSMPCVARTQACPARLDSIARTVVAFRGSRAAVPCRDMHALTARAQGMRCRPDTAPWGLEPTASCRFDRRPAHPAEG